MERISFSFDKKKAIEAILYLSHKISRPDIYAICKLLYLADKTSLERYGRFLFGETYYAMKEGATPSNAYDLLKKARSIHLQEFQVRAYQIIPNRHADLNLLSESDIECLDDTINRWGNKPIARRQAAHDDAWKRSWDKRGTSDSIKIPIEHIAELFGDSEDIKNYLYCSDKA